MFMTIVFTLSCLPLTVLTDGIPSYVDITLLQKEERQEHEDILFINKTLSESTGIKVHHARKALDNQHVRLVLEVEELYCMSSLTSTLSTRGYLVSVKPLQKCSDYAKELDVVINYHNSSEVERYNFLNYFALTYYDQGIGTDDYLKMMKKHFQRNVALLELGIVKEMCYQIYGHFPVQLVYFTAVNYTDVTTLENIVREGGKASQEMQLLQSFRSYMKTCYNSSNSKFG